MIFYHIAFRRRMALALAVTACVFSAHVDAKRVRHRAKPVHARPSASNATPQLQTLLPKVPLSEEQVLIDDMTLARRAAAARDPAEALARYLRVLARDPRDLEALTGAGRAALDSGDANAAINFFARAEEMAPRNGMIKAGLGSAMVQLVQPKPALRLFQDAVELGVPVADIAADRGLAYDLRGDTKRARADYELALQTKPDPDVTRRLAVSIAISGDRPGALAVLDGLLRQQDKAAWRDRAFILAISGDVKAAEDTARAILPRPQAEALQPFLGRIARLKSSQQAAAVHFGQFPYDGRQYSEAELFAAAGIDVPVLQVQLDKPSANTPAAHRGDELADDEGDGIDLDKKPLVAKPMTATSGTVRSPMPAQTVPPRLVLATPAPVPTPAPSGAVAAIAAPVQPPAPPTAAPAAIPNPAASEGAGAPLTSFKVDPSFKISSKIFPAINESPKTIPVVEEKPRAVEKPIVTPAPAVPAALDRLAAEKAAKDKFAANKAAQAKLAADKAKATRDKLTADKAAKDKLTAEKTAKDKAAKAKTAAATKKDPERYWVQVATGAYKPDLGKAWNALKAKYPALLGRQNAWTTPLNRTNRLLIGPFRSSDEAQAFVNRSAGTGFITSRFTSLAGQSVERLAN